MGNKSVLTILYQLAKQGNADKEVLAGLKSVQQGVGMAMGAFAALAGVAYTVDKALDATVGTFVNYAAQVRELNRLTGAGSEETSRLIQMADDLTISYESLQKSLWFASKNGVEVNVESLAELADQYVALNSPMAQADFLAQKFGKSGAEMAKMLEQGGNAVREWAGSIEGSLVLTDQAVQEAREYELALDTLNDQFEAMKVGIGQEIVPALNEMLFGLNNQTEIQAEANRLIAEGIVIGRENALAMAVQNLKINEYTDGLDSAGASYRAWAESMAQSNDGLVEQGETIEQINQRNTDMLSLIMNLQSQNDTYNESLAALTDKMAALKTEQDGYLEGSPKYDEIQAEMDQTGAAIEQLAADHEEAGKRIAFSLLQQKLAVDGLTDAEFSNLLEIGQQWGIIDATTATAAESMMSQVDLLSVRLSKARHETNMLHNQWTKLYEKSGSVADFYININVRGSIPNLAPWMGDVGLGGDAPVVVVDDHDAGSTTQRAEGGPLGADWTMVGERGMELISPSGYVFTNEESRALLASGIVPGAGMALGGKLGKVSGLSASYTPKKTIRVRDSELNSVAPGSGAGEQEPSTVEAVQNSANAAEVAAEASANAQASVQAISDLTAIQNETKSVMQGIRDDLQRNNATMRNSFIAAAEQIRG